MEDDEGCYANPRGTTTYRVGAFEKVAGLRLLPGQHLDGFNALGPPLQTRIPRESSFGPLFGRDATRDRVLGRPHLDAGGLAGP